MSLSDIVNENIIRLAAEKGISLQEISLRIGRSRSYLSVRINRKQTMPLDEIPPVADVLGVPYEELLSSSDKPHLSGLTITASESLCGIMQGDMVYYTEQGLRDSGIYILDGFILRKLEVDIKRKEVLSRTDNPDVRTEVFTFDEIRPKIKGRVTGWIHEER
ncbi:MAG: helix-turn-helix domain-containing protein [Bullifex sp.]